MGGGGCKLSARMNKVIRATVQGIPKLYGTFCVSLREKILKAKLKRFVIVRPTSQKFHSAFFKQCKY